jgi:hypothetical protein
MIHHLKQEKNNNMNMSVPVWKNETGGLATLTH